MSFKEKKRGKIALKTYMEKRDERMRLQCLFDLFEHLPSQSQSGCF